MTEEHPNPVVLIRVGKNHEAKLLEGRLKAHGINARAEQLLALDEVASAQLAMGNAGIRIWVPEAQLQQAQEILAELKDARSDITDSELERQAMEAKDPEEA